MTFTAPAAVLIPMTVVCAAATAGGATPTSGASDASLGAVHRATLSTTELSKAWSIFARGRPGMQPLISGVSDPIEKLTSADALDDAALIEVLACRARGDSSIAGAIIASRGGAGLSADDVVGLHEDLLNRVQAAGTGWGHSCLRNLQLLWVQLVCPGSLSLQRQMDCLVTIQPPEAMHGIRRDIVSQIVERGGGAVAICPRILRDEDLEEGRAWLLNVLKRAVRSEVTSILPHVRKRLRSPDMLVAKKAAAFLSFQRDTGSLPLLRALAKRPSATEDDRSYITSSIRRLTEPKSHPKPPTPRPAR